MPFFCNYMYVKSYIVYFKTVFEGTRNQIIGSEDRNTIHVIQFQSFKTVMSFYQLMAIG